MYAQPRLVVVIIALFGMFLAMTARAKPALDRGGCGDKRPIVDVTFSPSASNLGHLEPILLPTSADNLEKLTAVELHLSWAESVEVKFFYNARVSTGYPIFRIQYYLIEGDLILDERLVDFTQGCTEPTKMELYADIPRVAAEFAAKLSEHPEAKVRVLVWGGNF